MAPKSSKCKIISKRKPKFSEGEKILCFQGRHLYEAKCLQTQIVDGQNKYFVHYFNFKSKYDEWVTEDRMLKFNKENIQLQQDLRRPERELSKRSRSRTKETSNPKSEKSDTCKRHKTGNGKMTNSESAMAHTSYTSAPVNIQTLQTPPFVCKPDAFLNTYEVKIRIPEDLATIIIDDWHLITVDNKILNLPTKMNINKVLNEYLMAKTQTNKLPLNHNIEGYSHFITDLKGYFNLLLNQCLLYPNERAQYKYLRNNYHSLTRNIIFDTSINTKKECKRAKHRFKKSALKKPTVNKEVATVADDIVSSSSKSDTLDNNSQGETSDSCTESVSRVSSTQLNQSCHMDFTKLYGAIHLLRMFQYLGRFLFFTDLNEEQLNLINSYIHDFLKYLCKNLWIFGNYNDVAYVDYDQSHFQV